MSHVSSIGMMSHVSFCLILILNVLARLVSSHLCLSKCLCLRKKCLYWITGRNSGQ